MEFVLLKRGVVNCVAVSLLGAAIASGQQSVSAQINDRRFELAGPPTSETGKTDIQAKKNSSPARSGFVPRTEYAGDQVCSQCHRDIADSYRKTAHHLTSQLVDEKTILGNFTPGANTFGAVDSDLWFRMEKHGADFYQTAIWGPEAGETTEQAVTNQNLPPRRKSHSERLDLIIGSGGKGQNYLYWREDELFQLPVAWSSVFHQWMISPGYRNGVADFERAILPRCMECHAAYFESPYPGAESGMYNSKNFVVGISCENCHGPGRAHADNYSKLPAPASPAIVNPAKLSPDRQADICALCHGGQGVEVQPAFTFVPGQSLDNYVHLGPADSAADVDVHGMQGRLMVKSRCYRMSPDLNCSTCHNVHKPKPDLAEFSQSCLHCHKSLSPELHANAGDDIKKNCIDCHMPLLESKKIELDVNGTKVKPRFRSHWIRVYSEAELK